MPRAHREHSRGWAERKVVNKKIRKGGRWGFCTAGNGFSLLRFSWLEAWTWDWARLPERARLKCRQKCPGGVTRLALLELERHDRVRRWTMGGPWSDSAYPMPSPSCPTPEMRLFKPSHACAHVLVGRVTTSISSIGECYTRELITQCHPRARPTHNFI